jgi:DNA-binding NtrC family response regulator
MRKTVELLARAASCDATVLLTGETGCGKELAARALHAEGRRAGGPFEVLDCGAITPSLLADQLFGHVRGAFTGATNETPGVFERARGGTVLLDEIADLPLYLQPALLRICETGEVTRIGADRSIQVDVRIIASTRRNLADEVFSRRFREDLYYRLQVLPIQVPPLRERREDLPVLVASILAELGVQHPGPIEGQPLDELGRRHWAGNVRELRNLLARTVVLGEGEMRFAELCFEPEELPQLELDARASFADQRKSVLARFERAFFRQLLREHEGNLHQCARAAGLDRSYLRRMLRRYDLR